MDRITNNNVIMNWWKNAGHEPGTEPGTDGTAASTPTIILTGWQWYIYGHIQEFVTDMDGSLKLLYKYAINIKQIKWSNE